MQFQGRIYRLYPVQSGTSANGKEWIRQDFIFEYFENPTDRYADRVLLSVMNERIKEYNIHEGEECIIGFAHTTREYQGRVFNDVRLYHFEKVVKVNNNDAAKPQPTENTAQGFLGQALEPKVTDTYQQPQQAQLFPPQQPAGGEEPLPF